uniref:Uncharacterized protein n=1 Tax=uncultured bacterium contig00147 TaxID=1181587 RepID=A0A806K1E6_9BACT|nr:hypothetical protein [uncultured bacterium contig00147]
MLGFAGAKQEEDPPVVFSEDQIYAMGAIDNLGTPPSSVPMYAGDSGKDIRLAIFVPQSDGVDKILPVYIQGLLNENFKKYSGISIIDRRHIDFTLAQQGYGTSRSFSEIDYLAIGRIVNANHCLYGTLQRLPAEQYSLQLMIVNIASGENTAVVEKKGSLSQIYGNGVFISEVALDLLVKTGVNLTRTGERTLLAGNKATVQAQLALARGIIAQGSGSDFEALLNYSQSVSFDPLQIEALERFNVLGSSISEGNITDRHKWLEAFREAARFFNDHPPFEITFDPKLRQLGVTDYEKRTANAEMRIELGASKPGFDALNTLLDGLEKTGKRAEWGFSGWPLLEITPKTPGTVVFGGKKSFSFVINAALLNESGNTVGKGSITLNSGNINFSSGDKK